MIAITGTPGVGKSTLARALAKREGLFRLDLHHFYRQLSAGYDHQKQCYTVDLIKLRALVAKTKKEHPEGIVVDTHLSHLLPKNVINWCMVLTCSNLKLLQRRLQRRGYSSAKVRENIDAEIFQVCLDQAQEKGHKIVVLDVSKKLSVKSMLAKLSTGLNSKFPKSL